MLAASAFAGRAVKTPFHSCAPPDACAAAIRRSSPKRCVIAASDNEKGPRFCAALFL
jgi:hypothetical protein